MKIPTDALWFYECNFTVLRSPICFGHSCGPLQDVENKNTDIIKIYLNSLHSLEIKQLWV